MKLYSILIVYFLELRYTMGEANKKEAVAALHRARIMTAAEKLFSEKGYEQTTIEDISKKSEYSRRTIYAYYESKDDILHRIIEKGLQALKMDIEYTPPWDGDKRNARSAHYTGAGKRRGRERHRTHADGLCALVEPRFSAESCRDKGKVHLRAERRDRRGVPRLWLSAGSKFDT